MTCSPIYRPSRDVSSAASIPECSGTCRSQPWITSNPCKHEILDAKSVIDSIIDSCVSSGRENGLSDAIFNPKTNLKFGVDLSQYLYDTFVVFFRTNGVAVELMSQTVSIQQRRHLFDWLLEIIHHGNGSVLVFSQHFPCNSQDATPPFRCLMSQQVPCSLLGFHSPIFKSMCILKCEMSCLMLLYPG